VHEYWVRPTAVRKKMALFFYFYLHLSEEKVIFYAEFCAYCTKSGKDEGFPKVLFRGQLRKYS
jgi:hypothetical protein